MDIALDTSTDGLFTNSGTSHTFSHTCTGSNRTLFVYVLSFGSADPITGVTYNGVAMTQLAKKNVTTTIWIYIYGLTNPASGANDVVISASGAVYLEGMSASYTSVSQSGLPDATGSGQFNNISSGAGATTTVTTVADNCWGFLVAWKTHNTANPNASTGSTLRQAARGSAIFDSNGPKTPAGSLSMIINQTDGTQTMGTLMISFAPFVEAASSRKRMLMGVG